MADRCEDPTHRSYSRERRHDACEFFGAAVNDGRVPDILGHQGIVGWAVDAVAMDLVAGLPGEALDRVIERKAIEQTKAAMDAGLKTPFFNLDEMTEKGSAILGLFVEEVLDDWLDRKVYETQMVVHWDVDGVPWHAHVDVVFTDGSVIDLKTSEKRLGDNRADFDFQLTTYAAGLYHAFGHVPPMVGLDQLTYTNPPRDVAAYRPEAKKPWLDRQHSTRSKATLDGWTEVTRRRQDRQAVEAVPQTNGIASIYQCKNCPAKGICPAWTGLDGGPNEQAG